MFHLRSLLPGWRLDVRQAAAGLGVHDPDAMARVLRRERARSDRNSHGFSLLVLEPEDRSRPERLVSVVEAVQERVRDTDELGWLDDGRACVLLPETSKAGAEVVASDLSRRRVALAGVRCSVYAYPADAEEFAAMLSEPAVGRQGRRGRDRDDDDPKGGRRSRRAPRDRRVPRRKPVVRTGEPQELETLFLRPTPSWKRAFDVLVAGALLVLLSPLFLAIAVAIKLDTPGPVLFVQKRAGRGGRPFGFYKFRSMVQDAEGRKRELLAHNEQTGPLFKMREDPRITRVGRWLRRTSLDELPQLWNIVRGDMSLVGPRPATLDEVEQYAPWHRRRLEVDGGLTGLWQVAGRSEVKWPDSVRLDLRYIRARSLRTDLNILLKTVPAVLSGRGAN